MAIDTRKDFVHCHTDIQLDEIIKTSRLVSHLTGMVVQPNKAIVGRNAFSHESGIHQDGVLKKRQTYEIIDPARIGLSGTQLLLGKLSGRHAFRERVNKLGFTLSEEEINAAFARFKALADKKKYVFDEDIEAILEEGFVHIPQAWKLEYLRINTETGKAPSAEVKLRFQGKIHQASSTGDGPIDACYKAIEKIVKSKAKLVHYGIQSVTGGKDAQGGVVVKLQLGAKEVTGRATSTDIIEASAKAYLFAVNKIQAHLLPPLAAEPSPV
jgi:2-isopropylmalate synthase